MLLGCCHCDGPVSSSNVSSSSGVSSSSYNTNACSVCTVAPLRFSMIYTTPVGVSFWPCCTDYRAEHVLVHSSLCIWKTVETGIYTHGSGSPGNRFCTTSVDSNVKPRFNLSITGSLTYTIVMTHYMGSGGIAAPLRVSATFSKTVSSSDCFSSIRVPYSSVASTSSDSITRPAGTGNQVTQLDLCSTIARTSASSYIDLVAL